MLKKLLICSTLSLLWITFGVQNRVYAQELQILPLVYNESLAQGEAKKGHVDVINPSNNALIVNFNVKGFKQVDDQGNLEFFESKDLSDGIMLDLKEVELKPREALRLYFIADSKKLPGGDVFAAILASNKAVSSQGITSTVEVGTLLVLQNGPGGPRDASLYGLRAGFFQFDPTVSATMKVRNDAPKDSGTGFYPTISASLGPWLQQEGEFTGPLIFGGITRETRINMETDKIGLYRLSVSIGNTTENKWVLLLPGKSKWIALAIAVGVLFGLMALAMLAKKRRADRQGIGFGK